MQTLANWLELDGHICIARSNGHRLMLVLEMDLDHGLVHAQQVELALGECLWVNGAHGFSNPVSLCINASQANQALGSNRVGVIYNAHQEFSASAFSALAGTIEGGGLMVLLTPHFKQWISSSDQQLVAYGQSSGEGFSYFKQWWIKQWSAYDAVCVYAADTFDGTALQLATRPVAKNASAAHTMEPTEAQEHIIFMISEAYKAQKPMVYCLNAQRGRGKSACLGWSIKHINQELDHGPVIVTAPSKRAISGIQLTAESVFIDFWALDTLLQQTPAAAMLIVDEAAAVPLSQLIRLAERYRLLVLSSTQDGYEGSGQGYRLKLPSLLADLGLQTMAINLVEPMRWRGGDSLEALVKTSFLCDQHIDPIPWDSVDIASLEYQQVTSAQLVKNQPLLQQVYGLLMLAHYQTSPQDLRQLLDHTSASIHVWCRYKTVVGVAWVGIEGGFDAALANHVELAKRRVQGHLLAQILAQQAGFGDACRLLSWRIQRIAVLPSLQGQGVGSVMLAQLKQVALQQGIDYLGASFAADYELVKFWHKNHYQSVWLGLTTDSATGLNSVQFMQPLSAPAISLLSMLVQHFHGYLWFNQKSWFNHLSSDLWTLLAGHSAHALPMLDSHQKIRLLSILAHGSANIHSALYILNECLIATNEQQQLIKTVKQSKKDYQNKIRLLALKYIS